MYGDDTGRDWGKRKTEEAEEGKNPVHTRLMMLGIR